MAKTKEQRNAEYRERVAKRGLVQMFVTVPEKDRERVLKYAAKLRREFEK